jgi:hypothetical protein
MRALLVHKKARRMAGCVDVPFTRQKRGQFTGNAAKSKCLPGVFILL